MIMYMGVPVIVIVLIIMQYLRGGTGCLMN